MSRNEDRIIRFSGVKSGTYTYNIVLDNDFFEEYKNEEIEGGKVNYSVVMERSERVTMLYFRLEGYVLTRCDRCLDKMELRIDGEESLNVRFSDSEQSDDENTVVLSEDANELDITPWLYEYVAVRIPLQHMHPEGECDPETVKYLGTETAERDADYIDPRWEALKNLK